MDPVRKEVVVEAPVERAFRVFTAKYDSWWPREHHIGKADLESAVMEPREGGRWYEIGVDGSECDWGKVLVWDPPKRVLLAWNLNADWEYDPSLTTEVEVSFIPVGPMKTRVVLEHRYMERFGEKAAQTREGLDSEQGWAMHLGLFAKTVERELATA
jgi:uncharacterized protein YndB with AHSA1/START domain